MAEPLKSGRLKSGRLKSSGIQATNRLLQAAVDQSSSLVQAVLFCEDLTAASMNAIPSTPS